MIKLLNWIIAYAERMQVVEAHSTQKQTSLLKQKTITSVLIAYIKKIILITKKCYNYAQGLSSSAKIMIFLGIVISVLVVYKIVSKNKRQPPPSSPSKITKISAAKKSASLLSMKRFQSQSQLEHSQQETQKVGTSVVTKKMTKQLKQYCTDIETEPQNGQYQTVMESKKDKIFFNLLGSYQQAGQKLNQLQKSGKFNGVDQQQFDCEYGDQSQMSPLPKFKSPKQDPPPLKLK